MIYNKDNKKAGNVKAGFSKFIVSKCSPASIFLKRKESTRVKLVSSSLLHNFSYSESSTYQIESGHHLQNGKRSCHPPNVLLCINSETKHSVGFNS